MHKTAFYALMLTKILDTSPDTLILLLSKWVGITEISLGLHFYRSEQDYFNLNNYIIDIVANCKIKKKAVLIKQAFYTRHFIYFS